MFISKYYIAGTTYLALLFLKTAYQYCLISTKGFSWVYF